MLTMSQLLQIARVGHGPFGVPPNPGVVITSGNQLMGAYRDLKKFQSVDEHYFGWHAHHIVEYQDFERLGIGGPLPSRDEQLCVLLPERAHIGRINSVLNSQNPHGVLVTSKDLRAAYRAAYDLVGNYCGSSEEQIKRELLAVVGATFKMVGLP